MGLTTSSGIKDGAQHDTTQLRMVLTPLSHRIPSDVFTELAVDVKPRRGVYDGGSFAIYLRAPTSIARDGGQGEYRLFESHDCPSELFRTCGYSNARAKTQ